MPGRLGGGLFGGEGVPPAGGVGFDRAGAGGLGPRIEAASGAEPTPHEFAAGAASASTATVHCLLRWFSAALDSGATTQACVALAAIACALRGEAPRKPVPE
jgi:hypothetical protein